jgi:hypothetical protein
MVTMWVSVKKELEFQIKPMYRLMLQFFEKICVVAPKKGDAPHADDAVAAETDHTNEAENVVEERDVKSYSWTDVRDGFDEVRGDFTQLQRKIDGLEAMAVTVMMKKGRFL